MKIKNVSVKWWAEFASAWVVLWALCTVAKVFQRGDKPQTAVK